jgi:hypothetical protein
MTNIVNETLAREELTVTEYNALVQLISDNVSEPDDVEYLGTFYSEDEAIEAFFSEEHWVVGELIENGAVSINTSAALDFMEYSYDAYVLTDWTQDDPNSYLIKLA